MKGIKKETFDLFKNNPEEFISKTIKLIKEKKATMIVNHISYNKIDGVYDSSIITAEKNIDLAKAIKVKKNVQDYVIPDSKIEYDLANDMELDNKVVVYAKLPKGFQIPTPVVNYAPEWAIVFEKKKVKHIFFVTETKGTMETLPIELAKIKCVRKLFSTISSNDVVYHDIKTYQNLLAIMESK